MTRPGGAGIYDAVVIVSRTLPSGRRAGRAALLLTVAVGLLAAATAVALLLQPPAEAAGPSPSKLWSPKPGVSWQWQLSGRIDTSVRAKVYDIDAEVPRSTVSRLKAQGRRVICYISAGSFENWRPDAGRFPDSVKGRALDGWPGERWLDIRQRSVLGPIMARRMDVCRAKGFDGVEADNVDGYSNPTGFPLTGADQLAYNRMLARLAHARGLAIGLKNDVEQVRALQPYFDFAVNEECVQYEECGAYRAFVRAGKAVFHAEYEVSPARFCPISRSVGMSSIRKRYSLGAWRQTC